MRKSKKNDLKILEGDFKKERPNDNIPRMPRGLSPESKHWWRKMISVIDSSTLLPCYSIVLSLLCSSLASYERVKKTIDKEGETYPTTREDGTTIRLMRPEVEILSIYHTEVLSGLREFLATPLSRIKFARLKDDVTNDFKREI